MPTNSSAPQSSGALVGAPHAKSPARHSRPGLELEVAAPGPHTSPETPHQADSGTPDAPESHRASSLGEKKSKLHEEKYRPVQLGETGDLKVGTISQFLLTCAWSRATGLVTYTLAGVGR